MMSGKSRNFRNSRKLVNDDDDDIRYLSPKKSQPEVDNIIKCHTINSGEDSDEWDEDDIKADEDNAGDKSFWKNLENHINNISNDFLVSNSQEKYMTDAEKEISCHIRKKGCSKDNLIELKDNLHQKKKNLYLLQQQVSDSQSNVYNMMENLHYVHPAIKFFKELSIFLECLLKKNDEDALSIETLNEHVRKYSIRIGQILNKKTKRVENDLENSSNIFDLNTLKSTIKSEMDKFRMKLALENTNKD